MRLTVQGLQTGTAYAAQVRAVGVDGQSSEWSEIFNFTSGQNTTIPAAPASSTWVVSGDAFLATWTEVTTDISGGPAIIVSYELELTAGPTVKYVSVVAQKGNGGAVAINFADNVALFGTAQPSISMRVRAVNNKAIKGNWTGSINAANPVPANVTGFSGQAALNGVDLTWTANTDADLDRYDIYVGASSGFTPTTKIFSGNITHFFYTSSTYSAQYFKIRAVDKFGSVSAVDTQAGPYTPVSPFVADVTAPATPTSLAATITNNANGIGASASVTWVMSSPPSDLAGYNIRYRPVSTTPYQYMYGIDSGVLTATVQYLAAYTNYEFQIQAYDFSSNKSAWSSTLTVTSPSNSAPGVPTSLSSVATDNSITYTWANTDVDIYNYEVTFSTSSTFASGNVTYLTGTAKTLTVGGLTAGTTYYARVRSVDTGGATSAFTATDTRATSGVVNSDGSAPASSPTPTVMARFNGLYATWTPVSNNDPVTYEVHLGTSGPTFTVSGATKVTEVSGASMLITNLPGTSTALTYGTTYYVRLIAKDKDGAAAVGTAGSGVPVRVASTDVTSIGADLIIPGTGFIATLVMASTGSIQSSNWNGTTTGYKLSNTGLTILDAGSAIKVDSLTAGTIGSSTGVINVAAGASLKINGGAMYSNTYGSSTYNAGATSGWFLDDTHFHIPQGQISAAALITSNLSTATITMTGTGSITGNGWTLNSSGLTIPNGGVQAAALSIQTGSNLIPPAYADFELQPTFYTPGLFITNGTASIDTTDFRFGKQSLKWTPSSTSNFLQFGTSTTDYNMVLNPGITYIVSYYAMVKTGAVAASIAPWFKTGAAGTLTGGASASVPANSVWNRYSTTITVPGGANGVGQLFFFNSAVQGPVYIDGIQVEEKISTSTTPSTWAAPGSTTIAGEAIRTGSIQSTALALDYNGSTIANVPAWKIDTAGGAVLGDVLIRGRLIMGITNDYENSISTGTDSNGVPYVYEDLTKLNGISNMQSYNYRPGEAGWSIRSNGYAEFLQLKANSISAEAISAVSPDKLKPGTMTADLIVGTSIRSIETDTLFITQKARTGTVCTLTMSDTHARLVGDQIQVALDTPDSAFDTSATKWATITAVSGTTISYTSPSGSGTISAIAATGTLTVQGRSVVMSPEGITLFQNDGISRLIQLPTDPSLSAYFSGDVETSSINIKDGMVLQGTNSTIAAGGVLTLNASIVAPSAVPSVSSYYDYLLTWMNNDYGVWKSGLWYDGTNYYTTNAFFGAQLLGTNSSGNFVSNSPAAIPSSSASGTPYGAIKAQDGKWYMLVLDASDGIWKVRRFATSGTGVDTYETQWTYDEHTFFGVTATEWKVDGWNGSALKDPVIGYGTPDGTNYWIYIARANKNGKIVVSRFNTTGVNQSNTTTNITDKQNLRSVNVGQFDFSGFRWVITTEGNSSKRSTNYVTNTSGTQQTTETFPSLYNSNSYGLCWNGTAFVGLDFANRLNTFSNIASSGTNVWYVKSSYFDGNNSRTVGVSGVVGNGTTSTITTGVAHGYVPGDIIFPTGTLATIINNSYATVVTAPTGTTFTIASAFSGTVGAAGTVSNEWETALSNYSQVTVTRRSKLIVSAPAVPAGAGNNIPDRARFYFSNTTSGGTYYRQANTIASNVQLFGLSPTFSGTTTTGAAFPAGTAARFVSNNGLLTISADGWAIFGSTTDVTAGGGNTPALRIGDITGTHLRADGNEIQGMSNDTTAGQLQLQASGGNLTLAGGGGTITLGSGSNTISRIRRGTASVTAAGGTGSNTVSHGGGTSPDMVVLTPRQSGSNVAAQAGNINGTTFEVFMYLITTGAVLPNGNVKSIDWIALWF